VYNSTTNCSPSAAVHNREVRNTCVHLGFVVSDLFFWKDPHILWCGSFLNQCSIYRQCRVGGRELPNILVKASPYEQAYPQKLGRGLCEYFP
jgi:hypothetical protein